MIRTGLIGYPLSHSLSPEIHEAAFRAASLEGEYWLYPIPPDNETALPEMTKQMRDGRLQGLNVTIPYKQTIIAHVDGLTPSALAIGAVNTLMMKEGRLMGHNTDAPGFLTDLTRFLSGNHNQNERKYKKNALILGAGGAARAVVYGLLTQGWKITLAVRYSDIGQVQNLISSFTQHLLSLPVHWILLEPDIVSRYTREISLIVNTTPVGMYPKMEVSPWPPSVPFPCGAAVYDVVYNPRQTRLVRDAQAAGLRATTGLGMLVEQAALSFACWTGCTVSSGALFQVVEALC
jgi:shikimate dehydrogenase